MLSCIKITYHLVSSLNAFRELCLLQGRPWLKLIPGHTRRWLDPWKTQRKTQIKYKVKTVGFFFFKPWKFWELWYCLISLLDEFFHVFFTEVGCFWPTMTIENSKVQDVVGHLWDLKAVFILLALTNERSTAYFWQADLWNGLAVANAGRQQDGLVNAIVPDAKRIPSGGTAAAVCIKACAAVPFLRGGVKWSPEARELEVVVLLKWSYYILQRNTAPSEAHKKCRWHHPDATNTVEALESGGHFFTKLGEKQLRQIWHCNLPCKWTTVFSKCSLNDQK